MYLQLNSLSRPNTMSTNLTYHSNSNRNAEKTSEKNTSTHKTSINAVALKEQTDSKSDKKASYVKSLNKQMETIKEEMQKVSSGKLDEKSKADKLKQLRQDLANIQKELATLQQEEIEKQEKENEEKAAEKLAKKVYTSKEEAQNAAAHLESKMLTGIALAGNKIKEATPYIAKASAYATEAKLGMGPKYKGNLSLSEVQGLFAKASHTASYGLDICKDADTLAKQVTKVSTEYKKHQKDDSSEEERTTEDHVNLLL